MGIADSPLRDRAIFVEGVPRSGTSLLVTLLCLHPQIAGISSESHLFDIGIDRLFANFDRNDRRFLRSYVSRPELVDLVRDLCDGVLLRMRESTKPDAAFVVEKTPVPTSPDAYPVVQRKLECYPDAWFIHLVRDGRDVARSLARMPWMNGRSEAECHELWERYCAAIRDHLGSAGHYRELAYADLARDPSGAITELLAWLDLRPDAEYLQAVQDASSVPQDAWTATTRPQPKVDLHVPGLRRTRRPLRQVAALLRRISLPARKPQTIPRVVERFVTHLREQNEDGLRGCTTGSLQVEVAIGSERLSLEGDPARRALLDTGMRIFQPRLVNETWVAATGTWLTRDHRPSVTLVLSGFRGDGTRVEIVIIIASDGGLVDRAILVAMGNPADAQTERREMGTAER